MHFDMIESVKSLINKDDLEVKRPTNVAIIYRWWFPKDSEIVKILADYVQSHSDDGSMRDIFANIATTTIESVKYYALYLGKGVNGRRRFHNHVDQRKRLSTLRRTVSALLFTNDEEEISRVLSSCYFEWEEKVCTNSELKAIEKSEIKNGFYPLNLQENTKISDEWRRIITKKRKTLSVLT